jgi:hypothetical protein
MGYYNQDRIRREIGYDADPWGWTAHFGDELRGEETTDPGAEERGSEEGGES